MAGGVNTYTYVENDPANFIDPYGLLSFTAGGNSSVMSGGAGGSAFFGVGVSYDPNTGSVNACFVSTTCAKVGVGASASVRGKVKIDTGVLCDGNSIKASAFIDAGGVGVEGAAGSEGVSGSGAFSFGAGAGGSAGSQVCITSNKCIK